MAEEIKVERSTPATNFIPGINRHRRKILLPVLILTITLIAIQHFAIGSPTHAAALPSLTVAPPLLAMGVLLIVALSALRMRARSRSLVSFSI